MIYNRTEEDVRQAREIRRRLQEGIEPTEEEIAILERGTLTINSLNRIEEKTEELKNVFNSMGYWNNDVQTKYWKEEQIFYKADFERILDNLKKLKDSFFAYSSTPSVPLASYHFKNINDVEKILHDLDVMINDVKSNYAECGNFETGE